MCFINMAMLSCCVSVVYLVLYSKYLIGIGGVSIMLCSTISECCMSMKLNIRCLFVWKLL